jgi:hypothetical protein
MPYTLRHVNHCLGSARFTGTYEAQEDARLAAQKIAERGQPFMEFEVYQGTPQSWTGKALDTIRPADFAKP